MKASTAIVNAIKACYEGGIKQATAYLSRNFVIKATRRFKAGKNHVEIVVTIGFPNYAECKFINLCKKANEKFPIRKLQLKAFK